MNKQTSWGVNIKAVKRHKSWLRWKHRCAAPFNITRAFANWLSYPTPLPFIVGLIFGAITVFLICISYWPRS